MGINSCCIDKKPFTKNINSFLNLSFLLYVIDLLEPRWTVKAKRAKFVQCVFVFFLYQATTVYLCCLWERGDLWLKLAIPVIFMKPSKKQYLEAMADLPGSHKTTILLLGVIH